MIYKRISFIKMDLQEIINIITRNETVINPRTKFSKIISEYSSPPILFSPYEFNPVEDSIKALSPQLFQRSLVYTELPLCRFTDIHIITNKPVNPILYLDQYSIDNFILDSKRSDIKNNKFFYEIPKYKSPNILHTPYSSYKKSPSCFRIGIDKENVKVKLNWKFVSYEELFKNTLIYETNNQDYTIIYRTNYVDPIRIINMEMKDLPYVFNEFSMKFVSEFKKENDKKDLETKLFGDDGCIYRNFVIESIQKTEKSFEFTCRKISHSEKKEKLLNFPEYFEFDSIIDESFFVTYLDNFKSFKLLTYESNFTIIEEVKLNYPIYVKSLNYINDNVYEIKCFNGDVLELCFYKNDNCIRLSNQNKTISEINLVSKDYKLNTIVVDIIDEKYPDLTKFVENDKDILSETGLEFLTLPMKKQYQYPSIFKEKVEKELKRQGFNFENDSVPVMKVEVFTSYMHRFPSFLP
jgi:hypothetical protein